MLDWSYWPENAWGSHEFDKARFPDPKGMVDSIHALNAKMMISVWPKFYMTTEHYKEFDEKGWMYQQAVKDSIRDWIGPGYVGSFYDAYAEGARKLFWEKRESYWKWLILFALSGYLLTMLPSGSPIFARYVTGIFNISCCAGIAWIFSQLSMRPVIRILEWFGAHSLELYLVHVTIRKFMKGAAFHSVPRLMLNCTIISP